MLRVGLLGFTLENANKGCEALTYSFLYSLSSIYKGKIKIRFYSTTELFGQIHEFFPDMDFSFFQLSRKNILSRLKQDFSKNCDIVFDISFGDGFSDIYNPKTAMWNTFAKIAAGLSDTPFVLLPQTYGPFERKELKMLAACAIKKADVVLSRDELSSAYVKEISGVSAMTVTDLAFSLPFKNTDLNSQEKKKVGINVSGLLWKGGFYKDNQFQLTVDYQMYIRSIIENLLEDVKYEIHLIPHVIENVYGSNDGDLFVNDLLAGEYGIIKAPAFRNPIETKNYIASMDVVTAARMHATVDAFSAGVPVIPFAYSRKFEGLYGSIGYSYIIDGNRMDTKAAITQTLTWIHHYESLKTDLTSCMNTVDDKMRTFNDTLRQLLPMDQKTD